MFECISFFEHIEDVHVKLKKGSYLLLIAEETPFLELPKIADVKLCGAIFPHVIFKGKTYAKGMILAKLSASTTMEIVDMNFPQSYHAAENTNAIFAIVDGFSSQINDFVEAIYTNLPQNTKFIGSGAGKTSFIQEPIILDSEHFYMNSAIIVASSKNIGLGVKHGWKPLVGPFIATQCKGTTLEKINYKDAFSVYQKAVEKDSGLRFETTPFFKISRRYPLGIIRYNKDFVVREPVKTDGKNLVVVGNLDENSVLSILKADKEDLIQAAHEAALHSKESMENSAIGSIIVIDCVSRYLLLGDDFKEELEAILEVYPKQTLMWGAISLGEIANTNQESIEFYNNTCVVGTFQK